MFKYPYGDSQQLNLDWILAKLKELVEAAGRQITDDLETISNALISATFSSSQAYNRSDIVFHDGKLYRANVNILAPGESWNPAHWDEIMLGDTVSNVVTYLAALSNNQVFNSSTVPGTHTSDALNELNGAINTIINDLDEVSGFHTLPASYGSTNPETFLTEALANVSEAGLYFARRDYGTGATTGYFGNSSLNMLFFTGASKNYVSGIVFSDNAKQFISFRKYENTYEEFHYLDEISNLNGAINLLSKRRFVIIGDSYTEGYSPDNNVSNSWAKLFRQYLGLANADCEIVYRGGAGFIGNSQGKSFIDLLADSAISSPSTVTDIIVAGGYNDKSSTEANVKTAIATFCTNAKTKYPNAQVYIAEIGWAKSGTGIYEFATLASKYLHGAAENGAVCIAGAQYAMHNYFVYFSSDGFHPNQQGQSNIAYQMINFFNGSGVDVSYPYTSINITNCPFTSNNVSSNLGCDMNNAIVNFSIKGSTIFSSTSGVNMGAADGATLFDLGEITSGYIFGNAYNTIALPVSIQVKNNNVFYWCLGNMVIKNGHLYLAMRINENNDVLQMSSVTSLVIYRSGTSFNALMC